ETAPEQRLESIHRKLVINYPPDSRCCYKNSSEDSSETLCAEFTRECRRQDNSSYSSECGPQQKRGQRRAECMSRDPANHCDQRRLIDVTKRDVLGTCEVIQSVAKITV